MKLKLKIYRNDGKNERFDDFEIDADSRKTLLEILKEIKKSADSSLTFRHSCASGICGSCALRVNGKPVLACTHKPQSENITIEPLEGARVIRDLVIDESFFRTKAKSARNFLAPKKESADVTQSEMKNYQLQSGCIECASCYSICPVTKVNHDFLGPFILTKTWRYISDSREADEKGKIDAIQPNGVWDCILCGDCATVCPQGINSKMDISFLQMKSSNFGYSNPNFAGFSPGFGSFSDFNPGFQ